MELKLIVVSPKYQMNVGYIARIAKNFGVTRLFFLNPRANILGNRSVMYSKHAVDLLRSAKVYTTLESAVSDCDFVVGTTGILRSGPRSDNICSPEIALSLAQKNSRRVALLIGRDDTGLSVEELRKCDVIAHIGSNAGYPVLNISHALAVLLYVFTKKGLEYHGNDPDRPSNAELRVLMGMFGRMTKGKKMRDRAGVALIFRKMVRRSMLSRRELHALITAFK
jgi:TrmH family RNA methyltransferase